MAGSARHVGDLPWGWWLRAGESALEDEDGRTWRNVRDAFWQGRLGFPDIHFVQEQHELLLRVLTGIDARWLAGDERKHDLFAGDMMTWRFYQCWLSSIGLLETGGRVSALEAPLSAEGRSVMLMLQATRQPEWEDIPLADVVDAIASAGADAASEARERALRAFEREIGLRRHVFARERVGRQHLITLTGISTSARMPTRRVMWSQAFADERHRDDLFAWLAQHVDRWDDWGRLAYRRGADGLTSHLFMLVIAAGALSS